MGYQVYDDLTGLDRFAGYGVPAYCDVPGCDREIDRGLGYRCETYVEYQLDEETGDESEDEREGCGLHFCEEHHAHPQHGDVEWDGREHRRWATHLASDPSWAEWRAQNPAALTRLLERAGYAPGEAPPARPTREQMIHALTPHPPGRWDENDIGIMADELLDLDLEDIHDPKLVAHLLWRMNAGADNEGCIYADGDRDADYENDCPTCRAALHATAEAFIASLTAPALAEGDPEPPISSTEEQR